jgi:hypothetical protein
MPYKLTEIGTEPKKLLLRRGDILRWIGITDTQFDKVVKAGLLPWKRLRKGGARFYLKEEVRRVFLKGFHVRDRNP